MWPMIASLLASKLGQGQGDGNGGGISIPNPIGSVFSELSNAAMRAGGKEPVQNQQLGQQIIQPRSISTSPSQQVPSSPAPVPQPQTTMNALQGLIDQDDDKLKLLTAGRNFA